MCGIAGYWEGTGHFGEAEAAERAQRMTSAILHRGPDTHGHWADVAAGLVLGHRRLSILDLSPTGNQPMKSPRGRYVIVFNGEIYNHAALRLELEQRHSVQGWRGRSDTEVMLCAIEEWGLSTALSQFNGMYAFALWDKVERVLHLVRDRFGEKPLYYGWMGNTFLFGSELKALKAHPSWRGEIDRGALSLYLLHSYVPAPFSIYRGIHKLPPAHVLSIANPALREHSSRAYWSPSRVIEECVAKPLSGKDKDVVTDLDLLLREAVALRMEADVPLGAFLSGGIDSSLVVALMQAQSSRPVRTFSIGFDVAGYNEAISAKRVAGHLHTEHTELYVSPEEAMRIIPRLPLVYDEPFADSSQIPTYLVAQLARQHVTVALSGDAGDELFGGYNRYFWGHSVWRVIERIPEILRDMIRRVLVSVSEPSWDAIFSMAARVTPKRTHIELPGSKVHKLADALVASSPEELYRRLVSHWSPQTVMRGVDSVPSVPRERMNCSEFTQQMMFMDLIGYLPDDILTKVDRASMALSLETRIPYLDPRVAEFAWRLPLDFKIRDGQGKWILRQLLYKYVPRELVDRPKMGFGIPIGTWLRGPLRDWAENLLGDVRLRREECFEPAPIREKWQEHLSGKRNWAPLLWSVLMFQAWRELEA